MRTVKELKEELAKFPDDALCYAYEGEAVGIGIQKGDKQGFIFCPDNENSPDSPIHETELLNGAELTS